MINKFSSTSEAIIYQSSTGAIELQKDQSSETVWAAQDDIADIFEVERSVITKHIRNILKDKELDANSVCAKMARTAIDGKTYRVQFYNLDVILAVGYRTNSTKAIAFRKWATQVLKDQIVKGYSLNPQRLEKNYTQFLEAVAQVKKLLPPHSVIDHENIFELITLFADTWLSLDAYDRDMLAPMGGTKKQIEITADQLQSALKELRQALIAKGEATKLFGTERSKGNLTGIVGNVFQSFGDQELYPSIEEKAAHLLYFIIKNHPFVDGNKRSGAYAFIWLLRQAQILDVTRMSPSALTALTLLIAESNPSDKDKMVGLVCKLLSH